MRTGSADVNWGTCTNTSLTGTNTGKSGDFRQMFVYRGGRVMGPRNSCTIFCKVKGRMTVEAKEQGGKIGGKKEVLMGRVGTRRIIRR